MAVNTGGQNPRLRHDDRHGAFKYLFKTIEVALIHLFSALLVTTEIYHIWEICQLNEETVSAIPAKIWTICILAGDVLTSTSVFGV